MPRCCPAPIRRSPRRRSGSAAPRPTSKASCGGWSRPSRRLGEPRGGTPRLPLVGGQVIPGLLVVSLLVAGLLVAGLLVAGLLVFRLGEVLDDDAVHDLVPLGRVGFLVRIGRCRAPEPVT